MPFYTHGCPMSKFIVGFTLMLQTPVMLEAFPIAPSMGRSVSLSTALNFRYHLEIHIRINTIQEHNFKKHLKIKSPHLHLSVLRDGFVELISWAQHPLVCFQSPSSNNRIILISGFLLMQPFSLLLVLQRLASAFHTHTHTHLHLNTPAPDAYALTNM